MIADLKDYFSIVIIIMETIIIFNKHTESIAKAIQVPTDSNKFKSATIILVQFFIDKKSPENNFWTKGDNSWKSRSTMRKVELDL